MVVHCLSKGGRDTDTRKENITLGLIAVESINRSIILSFFRLSFFILISYGPSHVIKALVVPRHSKRGV